MIIISRAILIVFFLSLITGTLFLSTVAQALDDSSAPIHIEADRMISQEEKNTVVFIGNVDAKQGDLIIRTDEMTVFYEKDKNGEKEKKTSQVEKLICKGNVEISEGDWLGTGRRLDYFAQDRKAILSGDAKGWKGQNMVAGKTITYFLDEGRSIVEAPEKQEGETGRVKAIIHPDSD